MKYYEVNFRIEAPKELKEDASDMLAALAGEAGFETFEETEQGLKGYVQQSLFSSDALQEQLACFPFEDVAISYEITEAEDKDWNEQWEQEGFDPIVIDCPPAAQLPFSRLVVHDGRHLPEHQEGQRQETIEIDAKMAFGTGTHATTRMIISTLLSIPLQGLRILDCGCGTGILSIAALKCGANNATGYDIDEWSVGNARHNAVINGVDSRFTPLLGDASVLKHIGDTFDLVLVNINRNVLLADMPAFKEKMSAKAGLVLSGFYETDIPLLVEKARLLQLRLTHQQTDGEWACLVFQTE